MHRGEGRRGENREEKGVWLLLDCEEHFISVNPMKLVVIKTLD